MIELAPWLIAAYVLICLGAYYGNRFFMYFPDPTRIAPAEAGLAGVEEIELQTPDGVTLVAWYARAEPGRETILYFHGNAGNAAGRAEKIETMRSRGRGVFYLNNRGYGGSGGRPTEMDNIADALLAYDHLVGLGVPAEAIVLYGESLGSGQAVPLAARRPVKAMVLEAPLTSTPEAGRRSWWFLPLGLIITDQYRNAENIRDVRAPVLILHGEQDEVIPVDMGRRVYEAANEPKRLGLIPNASHNDMFEHGAWQRVEAFLEALPRE